MDEIAFQLKVREKIAGWYASADEEDRAVARMVRVREEIIRLLRSTCREGIDEVLRYLDESGFYWRASSPSGHHNWPGGLAGHSLGTCRLALKRSGDSLPRESVIIAAVLHDICKGDRFWFRGRTILQHQQKDRRHSARSIAILRDCGLTLTESERLAILWHMQGAWQHLPQPEREKDHSKAVRDPLWRVVFWADKADAAAHHKPPTA